VLQPYEWAVLRVVPRIERCEFVNAGVLVYSRPFDYLEAAIAFDPTRALALDSSLDIDAARRHLELVAAVCAGDAAVGGAHAERSQGERFRWLVAPRSTVVQASPVHTGLTSAPSEELARLLATMVLPPT
jgi:hypothetical protein